MSLINKNRKTKIYNNFLSEFKTLAQFVFIYEKVIKLLNREKDFKVLFKKSFVVFGKQLQSYIKYCKKEEINKPEEIASCTRQTFFFAKNKCKILDFSRHLRNSFCHAFIVKSGDWCFIQDSYQGRLSCVGKVKCNELMEFLNAVIKEYEEQSDKAK